MGPAEGLGDALGLTEAEGDTEGDAEKLGDREWEVELLGDMLADPIAPASRTIRSMSSASGHPVGMTSECFMMCVRSMGIP